MVWLVLRLLAVYFATAAVLLYLAHRFVLPLRPWVAILLVLGPGILVGKAMVTAGVYAPLDITYLGQPLASYSSEMRMTSVETPLLSDVVSAMIPWRKAVREAVKNGRLPLWNRFQMAGEPLLAVQLPAVLHPGVWIGFLLPLAQAWTFDMALRFFLALLCGYLFFRDVRCGELASLLGAAAWAFSDFLVFYVGYAVMPTVSAFPLLLLGLSRLVRDQDRRAVTVTIVALLVMLASGHPETLLHSVAGAGIFFLFQLGLAGRNRRMRPVLLSLLAGAISLGLSAAILLPFVEALPHTLQHVMRQAVYAHQPRSAAMEESLDRLFQNVVPYAFGVSGKGKTVAGFGIPAGYAGSLLFPLAVLGVAARRREKWPVLVLLFLGVGLWARLPILADAVARLPLFDIAINEYTVFLAAFALAALAAFGADELAQGRRRWVFVACAVAATGIFAAINLGCKRALAALEMPEGYRDLHMWLQTAPPAVAALVLALRARRHPGTVAVATLLAFLLVQRGLEEANVYPTCPSHTFYPSIEVLEKIPRGMPYRFAAVGYTFIPNASALYELEDVRGYVSMTLTSLAETFPLWCVPQPVWFNRVDDPTRPFLSFLNVRYVLADPGYVAPKGWKVLAEDRAGRVLENPAALPRAFVPRYLRYAKDSVQQFEILKSIDNFANYGVVEGVPEPRAASDWAKNGEANVRIVSYVSQKMTLEVEAKEPTLVATSTTRWPGWKIALDGREIPAVPYNLGFFALRVPAGKHQVLIRYWPNGFAWGLLVSGLTLLFSVVLVLFRRRSQA